MTWLVEREAEIFLSVYFGTILLVAGAEAFFPRRPLHPGMGRRWLSNVLIHLLDVGLVRWSYPLIGIAAALWAQANGWGLLTHLALPDWAAWLVSLALLDLAYYLQHRSLHQLPLLWHLHRVHHTDRDYDFSTSLRFHPLEALFTSGYDVAVLILLGPPPEAAALYGFFHLAWAIVVHANIAIPARLDGALRRLLVTPDLHRTHHSAEPGESMTNFGAVSPLWDKLFGSYKESPRRGHEGMVIGLTEYRDARHQGVVDMLLQPFLPPPDKK